MGLINHQQRWGFSHIPKTGGTSFRQLLKIIPDTEVITPPHISLDGFGDIQDYFLFTIVRNPYTKFMSRYFHDKRKGVPHDIDTYIQRYPQNMLEYRRQTFFINHGERHDRKINFIGRYENYEKDIDTILQKLGRQTPHTFPHLNKNSIYNKQPNLNQQQYYISLLKKKPNVVEFIQTHFERDFQELNYELDISKY
jgi:hypothetical protein